MFYDRTFSRGPFKTSDCLTDVTAWIRLTVDICEMFLSVIYINENTTQSEHFQKPIEI